MRIHLLCYSTLLTPATHAHVHSEINPPVALYPGDPYSIPAWDGVSDRPLRLYLISTLNKLSPSSSLFAMLFVEHRLVFLRRVLLRSAPSTVYDLINPVRELYRFTEHDHDVHAVTDRKSTPPGTTEIDRFLKAYRH